jgi:putative Holliday junction resolvase
MGTGRVLGVDFGDVRIGLSLSDSMRMVATPLETLQAQPPKPAFRRLRELIAEHGIEDMVVGLPLHMNGDFGIRAEASKAFAEKITAQVPGLEVHLWDERMTTAEANRAMASAGTKSGKRKQIRDQLAAQLILQSWLDAQVPPLA